MLQQIAIKDPDQDAHLMLLFKRSHTAKMVHLILGRELEKVSIHWDRVSDISKAGLSRILLTLPIQLSPFSQLMCRRFLAFLVSPYSALLDSSLASLLAAC